MPLHVQGEVVRSGEGPFAEPALERTVASVFPHVSGELIRPRKLPSAAFPGADVRLFARVSPLVGLQVGRLCVGLEAALNWAVVNDQLPLADVGPLLPRLASGLSCLLCRRRRLSRRRRRDGDGLADVGNVRILEMGRIRVEDSRAKVWRRRRSEDLVGRMLLLLRLLRLTLAVVMVVVVVFRGVRRGELVLLLLLIELLLLLGVEVMLMLLLLLDILLLAAAVVVLVLAGAGEEVDVDVQVQVEVLRGRIP